MKGVMAIVAAASHDFCLAAGVKRDGYGYCSRRLPWFLVGGVGVEGRLWLWCSRYLLGFCLTVWCKGVMVMLAAPSYGFCLAVWEGTVMAIAAGASHGFDCRRRSVKRF